VSDRVLILENAALLCHHTGVLRGHHVARRVAQAVGGRGYAHSSRRRLRRWAAWTKSFPSRRVARTTTTRQAPGLLGSALKKHLSELKAMQVDDLVAAPAVQFRNIAQFYSEG